MDEMTMVKAAQIARALVLRRIGWHEDIDEDRQDFTVWVLDSLRQFDPERGALSNWVYSQWPYWQYSRYAVFTRELHHEFDHAEPDRPDHRLTGRAGRLLEMVPAKGRELVETHLAYGASLTATAELHGVSDRTVSRWVAAAREIWSQEAA